MKLLNAVFDHQYLSLRDIVRDIDVNFTVEAVEQLIRNHVSDVIAAVVIGKLHKRE